MKKYTIEQIREQLDDGKDVLIVDKELVTILDIVGDHGTHGHQRIKAIFKKKGNYYYVKVDLNKTIKKIIKRIKPHVNLETFLKELILLRSSPEEIIELEERLEKPETSIRDAPRCYALMIGGKRGRPLEFVLIS